MIELLENGLVKLMLQRLEMVGVFKRVEYLLIDKERVNTIGTLINQDPKAFSCNQHLKKSFYSIRKSLYLFLDYLKSFILKSILF